jgi:hypothetical protein
VPQQSRVQASEQAIGRNRLGGTEQVREKQPIGWLVGIRQIRSANIGEVPALAGSETNAEVMAANIKR